MITETRLAARRQLDRNHRLGIRAPDFGPASTWLNVSRPLSLRRDFQGRVVLLDFWTSGCINCMHVLPDVQHLERKYASAPFAVIGVHSAKFDHEKSIHSLREAVLRHGITHPVVADPDFTIWSQYGVRAWPTLALIGPDGVLLAELPGEGHRDVLDLLIDEALARLHQRNGAALPPLPLRLERDRAPAAELSFPGKVIADSDAGRLYVADSSHNRILALDQEGRPFEKIGAGVPGFADGSFEAAHFNRPQGLALGEGALFVADTENHAIRRIDFGSRRVNTVAGTGEQSYEREAQGPALATALSSPWDLSLVGRRLFVAMAGAHQLWVLDLDRGVIGVFAGTGMERRQDGPRRAAGFAQPSGLATDGRRLFVADSESSSVRMLDLATGQVTTVAGGGPDPGDLFVFGDQDGVGEEARLQHPLGILWRRGGLFVADTYNHRIRRWDPGGGRLIAFAGTGVPGDADGAFEGASFFEPSGLAGAGDRLFVADTNNHRIRVLDLRTRAVSTFSLSGDARAA